MIEAVGNSAHAMARILGSLAFGLVKWVAATSPRDGLCFVLVLGTVGGSLMGL